MKAKHAAAQVVSSGGPWKIGSQIRCCAKTKPVQLLSAGRSKEERRRYGREADGQQGGLISSLSTACEEERSPPSATS